VPWYLDALIVAVGVALFAASAAGARRPTIPAAETAVFRAVNGWPGWLLWVLWLPMQAGNLVVGSLAGLAVAWYLRSWESVVAVVLAVGGKLVIERWVRARMAPQLAVRQRPGTSQPGATLRGGDVPERGPSFPSGHVILVAAIACVVSAESPGPWAALPWLFVAVVPVGRVYVGAHNPLDVTAGLGLGLALGGLVALVLV
jgi:membrane-associated phospholipid phosphatase